VRDWLVGGALIEGPDGLLLVQNRRRDGSLDWTPPGGVIDDGENLLDGLTREVREETGLEVRSWAGRLYEVSAVAPGLGWRLRVEAWVASDYDGELVLEDPDGIVVDARFVACDDCAFHLGGGHPWVADPVIAWLAERWAPQPPSTPGSPRSFGYEVDGDHPRSLTVRPI
jgi:8-oxo-dGTP diphosphatase